MASMEPIAGGLRTEEVARLLGAINTALIAECEDMRPEMASFHPAEGEWCVKECIGHMLEAERRGFAGRIRLILEEPGRNLKGWDQVAVERARNDCARELSELLMEFAGERSRSIELVQSLLNTDLAKSGEHEAVGTLTVEELLHEWVHHDRNHFRQLQANVQAYVWPSMGSAQRFQDID
jgi:DinB superfamily